MDLKTTDRTAAVLESVRESILTISFNRPNPLNPFSSTLAHAVADSLQRAEKNSEIRTIVLTGGLERSFSVGGDFTELKEMRDPESLAGWYDAVFCMYRASLATSKPVIAAVDNHAIGIGFQLAMTCDWRIGTRRCEFLMPELKNGLAGILGVFFLGKALGRARMQEMVYGCQTLSAERALEVGVLHEVVTPEELEEKTHQWARQLGSYPLPAFAATKKAANEELILGFDTIAERVKTSQFQALQQERARSVMQSIVK